MINEQIKQEIIDDIKSKVIKEPIKYPTSNKFKYILFI